jgi:hypothetical protein
MPVKPHSSRAEGHEPERQPMQMRHEQRRICCQGWRDRCGNTRGLFAALLAKRLPERPGA